MALAKDDIEFIAGFIRQNLGDWLVEQSYGKPPAVYEIELRERMVRVEEELKNQRELMLAGFTQSDKRFAEMQANMDKRFTEMQANMDKRFEQVDKRFEQMDKRFEQVDKRFELLTNRLDTFMRWSFGITLTVGGLVVAAIKYLP